MAASQIVGFYPLQQTQDGQVRYPPLAGTADTMVTAAEYAQKLYYAGVAGGTGVYIGFNDISATSYWHWSSAGSNRITANITANTTGWFTSASTYSYNTGDSANHTVIATSVSGTHYLRHYSFGWVLTPTDTSKCYSVLGAAAATTYAGTSMELHIAGSNYNASTLGVAAIRWYNDSSNTFTASRLNCYVNSTTRNTGSLLRSQKNGSNGGQSIALSTTTGYKEDTTNSDSIATGDNLCLKYDVGTSSSGVLSIRRTGVILENTSAEFLLYAGYNGGMSVGNITYYLGFGWMSPATDYSETTNAVRTFFDFKCKDLQVYVSTYGAGVSVSLVDDGSAILTVNPNGTGKFVDTSTTSTIASGSKLSLKFTTTSSTTFTRASVIAFTETNIYLNAGGNIFTATAPDATVVPGAIAITSGGNVITLTAPDATPLTGGNPLTITAGANTVTTTAPVATIRPAVSLAAGQNVVTTSAPVATIKPAVNLVAGLNQVVTSSPAATLVPGNRTLAANGNQVTITNPNPTIVPGAVNIAAGQNQVNLSAPNADCQILGNSLAAGGNTINFSAPNAPIVPGGVTLAANQALVTITNPMAVPITPVIIGAGLNEIDFTSGAIIVAEVKLAAGQNVVTISAPDAYCQVQGGPIGLAAGGNEIQITAPAATLVANVTLLAGQGTVKTDDFNRGSVGSDWTQANGTWSINTNRLTCASPSSAKIFYNLVSFGPDQYSQAKIAASSANWFAISARASGTGSSHTAYCIFINGTGSSRSTRFGYIFGTDWGEYLDAASVGVTLAAGDTLKLTVEGQNTNIVLKFYVNGNLTRTLAYADFTPNKRVLNSGQPGLFIYSGSDVFYDDWEGGDSIVSATKVDFSAPSAGILSEAFLAAGQALVTITNPAAVPVLGGVNVAAGLNLVTLQAPFADIHVESTGINLPAGANTVTTISPVATLLPGGRLLAAGQNVITITNGAIVVPAVALLAGENRVTITNPNASPNIGNVNILAGTSAVTFEAPTAWAVIEGQALGQIPSPTKDRLGKRVDWRHK